MEQLKKTLQLKAYNDSSVVTQIFSKNSETPDSDGIAEYKHVKGLCGGALG